MEPDNQSFSEVVRIEIPNEVVSSFRGQLAKIEQAYQDFVKRIGSDSGSVLQGLGLSELKEEIREFRGLFTELVSAVSSTQNEVIGSISQFSESLGNALSKGVKRGAKETIGEIDKLDARIQALRAKLGEAAFIPAGDKRGQFIDGINAQIQELERLQRNIGRIDGGLGEPRDRAKNLARDIANEQERIRVEHEERVRDLEQRTAEEKRNAFIKDQDALNKEAFARFQEEQKLEVAATKTYEAEKTKLKRTASKAGINDIDFDQYDVERDRATSLALLKEELETRLKGVEAEHIRTTEKLRQDADNRERDRLKKRELEYQAIFRREEEAQKRVIQQRQRLEQQLNDRRFTLGARNRALNGGVDFSPFDNQKGEDDASLKRKADALRQINRQIQEIQAQRQGGNFFERFFGGLPNAIVGLTRFFVVMQGIVLASQAIQYAFETPFLALKTGVDYLRQAETAADELVGTLQSNVKFSNDLVENFRLAQEAAKEIVLAIQDSAIQTGIKAEDIKGTFSALTESGAAGFVGNMREIVELATAFQLSLKAAGASGITAQESVSEISKLLQGNVSAGNKFLTILGISVGEWEKMRAEAKEHGNLLELLRPKMQPYLDAVEASQTSLDKLINQAKLLGQRLLGEGTNEFFEYLKGLLVSINQFLNDNKETIASWQRAIGTIVQMLIGMLQNLGNMLSNSGSINVGLRAFLIGLGSASSILNGILSLSEALSVTLRNAFDAKKLKSELADVFKRFEEQTKRTSNLITAGLTGDINRAFGLEKDPNKKSLIDTKTEGRSSDKNDLFNNVGRVRNEIQNLTTEFDQQLNRLDQAMDIYREKIKTLVTENQITQREANKLLESSFVSQRQAAQEFFEMFSSAADRQRRSLSGTDQEIKEASDSISRTIVKEREKLEQLKEKGDRQGFGNERLAVKERLSIQSEEFKGRLDVLKAQIDLENQLNQQRRSAELATDLQFFDKQTELQRRSFDAQRRELESRLLEFAADNAKRREVQNQIALLDQQRANAEVLAAEQRDLLVRQQNDRLIEFRQNLRALNLEAQVVAATLTDMIRDSQGLTVSQMDVFAARRRELDLLEEEISLRLEKARLENAESERTRDLTLQVRQLQNARLQALREEIGLASQTPNAPARTRLVSDALQRALDDLTDRLFEAQQQFEAKLQQWAAEPLNDNLRAATEQLKQRRDELARELESLKDSIRQNTPDIRTALRNIFTTLIGGDGVIEAFKNATTSVEKLAIASNAVSTAMSNIGAVVNSVQRGISNGGALGGVGAGLQAASSIPGVSKLAKKSGVLGFLGSALGSFAGPIGSALELIGGLFTRAAKKIAEEVRKTFQATIDLYNRGGATLTQTIASIERQRVDAISRLSGKKGGAGELEKLLPEIDSQLQSLKDTQKKILSDFDDGLETLRLNSDVLSEVRKKWKDINALVKDYLGAGGDAAKAAEYLSRSLAQVQVDAAKELEDSERDAIQNAIKLNDLLQERKDIVEDYAQREFDLLTQGTIERRQAGAVTRAAELADLRKERDERLETIDKEVKAATDRMNREAEIFKLTSDIATLKQRSDELALKALDEQIKKLKELKSIADGSFLGSLGSTNNTTINVDLTVNGANTSDPQQFGRQAVDTLRSELQRQLRLAPTG